MTATREEAGIANTPGPAVQRVSCFRGNKKKQHQVSGQRVPGKSETFVELRSTTTFFRTAKVDPKFKDIEDEYEGERRTHED